MKSSHSSPACLVHPRGVVLATATIVALAVSGTPARAQWGNWGWGGWGSGGGASTVQGNVAQGLGALAVGVGEGRQQTAVARSVNADASSAFYKSPRARNFAGPPGGMPGM